jgi:hypothetical protein
MIAKEFGLLMQRLVNDSTLKTLMNIPVSEISDYGVLVDKYFIQSYVSYKFTEDSICRLLIRKGSTTQTNNSYVKRDTIVIEVFVPTSIDMLEGFETRTNKICDRLITLLNRFTVNDCNIIFNTSYESISGTNYFKRYTNRFEYKKVYV